MGVHEIDSQAARTDTGVVVEGVDRETLRAGYRNRSMPLSVDNGLRSYGIYLPKVPAWDDGEPVSAADLAVIKAAVVEVLRHWGFSTEFIMLGARKP